MTRDISTILFDLDGTLVDTMQAFADIAAGILERRTGMPFEAARSRYLDTSGIPFASQLEIIVPRHRDACAMSSEFESQKRAVAAGASMDVSTIYALNLLRSQGIKLGISSNNYQDNVATFASASPFRFDFALGYSDHSRKGAPHLDHVSSLCQCSREQMLFVGDSLSDAATYIGCGVRFIAVTTTVPVQRFLAHFPTVRCIPSVGCLPRALNIVNPISNDRKTGDDEHSRS